MKTELDENNSAAGLSCFCRCHYSFSIYDIICLPVDENEDFSCDQVVYLSFYQQEVKRCTSLTKITRKKTNK